MQPPTLDVLVIGLGPAGARAAEAAARAGCAVLALDRRSGLGRPVQCAELVPGLIGQDLPLPVGVLAQPVRAMQSFVEREAADLTAPFPGHMVDRAVFDTALVEAAREAGARCAFGLAVRRVDPEGAVHTADGRRLRARVVIGADGPRSVLGRSLGRTNRELVHARQFSAPLAQGQDTTDVFLSQAYRGGYGWLFPKGGWAHVGVGVSATARPRLRALLEALAARLRDEGRIAGPRRALIGGAIPVGGPLPPAAASRGRLALLAGDAAGLANPVTGAGIHAALVSGALAGQAAAAWVAGDDQAGEAYAEELDDVFGASLGRAVRRRRWLLERFTGGAAPRPHELRAGWVAYPGYWREDTCSRTNPEEALA